MKSPIALVSILVALLALGFVAFVYADASGDFWISRTPMPILVKDSAATGANDEIFVMGFNYTPDSNSVFTRNAFNYAYNPATDRWFSKTSMPVLQSGFAIATYQDKIYLLGGSNTFPTGDSYYSKTNQVYDVKNDTWEIKTALSWPRWGMKASVVKDKIYVIGGMLLPNNVVTDVNQAYDPATDTWTTLTPLQTPVYNYASAVLDNKIYIIGGGHGGKYGSGLDLVQIYDPQTNNWTIGKPLPIAVGNAVGAVIGNESTSAKIVVLGVTNEYFDINSTAITQIYDLQSDAWTIGAPIPAPSTIDFSLVTVNGTIYAEGGKPFGFTPGLYRSINIQYVPSIAEPSPSPTANNSSPKPSQTPIGSTSPDLTPTPTITPTITDTPEASPSSQNTQTPTPQQTNPSLNLITIIEIIVVIIAVLVAAIVVWRTQKHSR